MYVRKKARTAAPLPCRPEISTTESRKVVPRRLSRSATPVGVSDSDWSGAGRSSTSAAATEPGTAHRSITAFTQRSNSNNGIKCWGSFLHISNVVAENKRSASETTPRVRRASTRGVGKTSGDSDVSRMVFWMEESGRCGKFGPGATGEYGGWRKTSAPAGTSDQVPGICTEIVPQTAERLQLYHVLINYSSVAHP